jgi:hypothetical protein
MVSTVRRNSSTKPMGQLKTVERQVAEYTFDPLSNQFYGMLRDWATLQFDRDCGRERRPQPVSRRATDSPRNNVTMAIEA